MFDRLLIGLFVTAFYHFYINDQEGLIGNLLRNHMPIAKLFDMDDKTFAYCVVSGFMQVMGILQMPQFLGPSFTPFGTAILNPFFDPSTWTVGKYQGAYADKKQEQEELAKEAAEQKSRSVVLPADSSAAGQASTSQAKKRKKNKKKKKTS